jgi:glyoxylase-like metal-dependent hydrolase (beta-lactamase superfamily II)
MNLSKTTFGNFNLYTIETGDIKLDGGAMFGVVPKTLWSRGIAADENNRISMTMRCLLVESTKTGKIYLIDNGAGTKFNEKMMGIYGIDHSEKTLEKSLNHHGFSFDQVTDIVFTHLHFDHCGGTTYFDQNDQLSFTFPNASYHINKRHWETAIHPNAREKASFLKENIEPLKESDAVKLIEDGHNFEDGFSTYMVNGHTIGQQLPLFSDGDRSLLFAADLLPTHVHLPLPWVMGYDMYPTETLLEKERFLNQASNENWFIYLEHDLEKELITINFDGKKASVDKTLTLNDI